MNDNLRNLQVLVAEKHRPGDGEARILALPVRTALAVQRPDAHLSEAQTSDTRDSRSEAPVAQQETTLMLKISHDRPLPDLLISVLEQRAYDYCAARSVRADVDGMVWYELSVKEQP